VADWWLEGKRLRLRRWVMWRVVSLEMSWCLLRRAVEAEAAAELGL
jgi:hypothetical protein